VSTGASLDAAVHESAGRGRGADESSWMMKDARDTAADGTATVSVGGTSHEVHEELWKSLSPNHWPTLFAFYNMSLTGRSVPRLTSLHVFYMCIYAL